MASPTSPVSVDSSRTDSLSPGGQSSWVEVETFTVNAAVPERRTVVMPSIDTKGRVAEFSSILDAAAIRNLARKYMFPESCVLIAPREVDRACSPPVGFITLYEDSLVNGLRFPLHPIYIELQHLFGIQLGQLMPNSYKQIVALGVEANRRNMPLSPAMLFRFYGFKVSDSWFYLSPRLGFRVKTKSKIANWQRKFFFCDAEDVFPHVWRTGRLDDFWSEETFGELEKLGIISEEYSEVDLALAGLSPYDPATMVEPVKGESCLVMLIWFDVLEADLCLQCLPCSEFRDQQEEETTKLGRRRGENDFEVVQKGCNYSSSAGVGVTTFCDEEG